MTNRSNKTKAKYKVGDYVLIKAKSMFINQNVWVGKIHDVENSVYVVKNISGDRGYFLTKIPFLFHNMIYKIDNDKLDSVLKAVKILYSP